MILGILCKINQNACSTTECPCMSIIILHANLFTNYSSEYEKNFSSSGKIAFKVIICIPISSFRVISRGPLPQILRLIMRKLHHRSCVWPLNFVRPTLSNAPVGAPGCGQPGIAWPQVEDSHGKKCPPKKMDDKNGFWQKLQEKNSVKNVSVS